MAADPESVVINLVDAKRSRSAAVRTTSIESLRRMGEERFGVAKDEPNVLFYEDSDGTVIEDDDYLLHLDSQTAVMLCQGAEKWQPEYKRADWLLRESAGGEESASDNIDGFSGRGTADVEQEKYAEVIRRMMRVRRMAQGSGSDAPDGRQESLSLDDIALLCESDTGSLAQHIGLKLEEAEELQQYLQKQLSQLQVKEDLHQLEELVKSLRAKGVL